MGQPIYLVREEEETVVHGPNQARVMMTQGWRPKEEEDAVAFSGVDDLTVISGVGEATAAILADAGFRTYVSIADAPVEKLVALDKISLMTATKIQKNAADLVYWPSSTISVTQPTYPARCAWTWVTTF
jgi:predicted flap endonuclease-1-like 5' DNA nuclease